MNYVKRICVLLAAVMLLTLAACGEKKPKDANVLQLGDYELLYKGAAIMKDSEGYDALVLTLDYTNNSDTSQSYLLSVMETATQKGKTLPTTLVYPSEDTYISMGDSQFTEVEPGKTLEIHTCFLLTDTSAPVEVLFEELFDNKSATITVDPSTLTKNAPDKDTAGAGDKEDGEKNTKPPAQVGDALLDWWNGPWYGWWVMSGCYGGYEDMEGSTWDVCADIDIGQDYTGTVTLWDEDYTKDDPMSLATVSLDKLGTGDYGTMMSEEGYFTDLELYHADWIVDPGLEDVKDVIHINGYYEKGDDQFTYDIYLRPWGTMWDDVVDDQLPFYYHDWYLPLVEAGEPMPDDFAGIQG